jgi:hypothetical protein
LECAKILNQLKSPVPSTIPDEVEAMAKSEAYPVDSSDPMPLQEGLDDLGDDLTSLLSEPPHVSSDRGEERDEYDLPPMPKKPRGQLTLEEYEAMLDAEDAPGGFLEAGDIAAR